MARNVGRDSSFSQKQQVQKSLMVLKKSAFESGFWLPLKESSTKCCSGVGAVRYQSVPEFSRSPSGLVFQDIAAPHGLRISGGRSRIRRRRFWTVAISCPERSDRLDAPIAARVTMHENAVNREAFAANDAGLTALLDNFLKQYGVNVALAKSTIAVLGEGRMIRQLPLHRCRRGNR
jgi:hypothetical protein